MDSLQLTEKYGLATPVQWTEGKQVIIPPDVPDSELESRYPQGVETVPMPSGKGYLRYTPHPPIW